MQLMWERAGSVRGHPAGMEDLLRLGRRPYASGWWLDSDIGMEFLQNVAAISRKYPDIPPLIATHKGFALPGFDKRGA